MGEDVILPEHSIDSTAWLAKPGVRTMLEKILVVADLQQKHYHQCAVTLFGADGQQLARRDGRGPKGSPQNPMTDEEASSAGWSRRLSGTALDDYLAKAQQLGQQQEWTWLVRTFA